MSRRDCHGPAAENEGSKASDPGPYICSTPTPSPSPASFICVCPARLNVWRLSHSRQATGTGKTASDNAWECEMACDYVAYTWWTAAASVIRYLPEGTLQNC